MCQTEVPMSITTRLAISSSRPFWRPHSISRHALWPTLMLLAACGGSDSGSPPNTPLTTPTAMVANQDDTTMTTVRLDGKGSPVISTLSLGPVQADAIGGMAFSLGEWIFVANSATNRVATIDPIGALTPILEDFLEVNGIFKIGQRPNRIYRDPIDKEVLWTMNEGDRVTGIDTVSGCLSGGSTTVLHNSHILVGGEKPHITKTACLSGTGEHFMAHSRPTAAAPGLFQRAFISSKTTGLISVLFADATDGILRWNEVLRLDLCDSAREQSLGHPVCDGGFNSYQTPNHSAPAGMFWSQATGMIYSYLSGYGTVVEIDPSAFAVVRTVDITLPIPSTTVFHSVGITPDGRFLLLVGEDLISDPAKVIGKFSVVDLGAAVLSITPLPIPELDNLRPAFFQFTPDGKRLYLLQSNTISDLAFGAQADNLKLDRLLVFDPSVLPTAPAFVAEVPLPAGKMHGMDLWITGPQGAGSAKGVVVTNATLGVKGSVSLIEAVSHTITATIPVGKNPKQVTVYYVGLAASDNQATPTW